MLPTIRQQYLQVPVCRSRAGLPTVSTLSGKHYAPLLGAVTAGQGSKAVSHEIQRTKLTAKYHVIRKLKLSCGKIFILLPRKANSYVIDIMLFSVDKMCLGPK